MGTEFVGIVYASGLPQGRAQASIDVEVDGVVARTGDGTRIVIPFDELDLELGGTGGKGVYCRNADRSITIFTGERELLRSLAMGLHTGTATKANQLLSQSRRKRLVGRGVWWSIGVALVLLLASAPFLLGYLVERSVNALPTSLDVELGEAGITQITETAKRVEHPLVDDAMAKMLARLKQHIPDGYDEWDFRVMVIEDDSINAFALPGGQMVFHSGLLVRAGSAEEVAGVMAHEMAHVLERHGLQRVGQSLGVIAGLGLLLGDAGVLVGAAAEFVTVAAINNYSRSDEAEADAISVTIMHNAGLDPNALSVMFERMAKEGAALPDLLHWVSTHPSHEDRIGAIADQVAKLPAREPSSLDVDWAAVRKALGK